MLTEVTVGKTYTSRSGFDCSVLDVVKYGEDCEKLYVIYVNLTNTFDSEGGTRFTLPIEIFRKNFSERIVVIDGKSYRRVTLMMLGCKLSNGTILVKDFVTEAAVEELLEKKVLHAEIAPYNRPDVSEVRVEEACAVIDELEYRVYGDQSQYGVLSGRVCLTDNEYGDLMRAQFVGPTPLHASYRGVPYAIEGEADLMGLSKIVGIDIIHMDRLGQVLEASVATHEEAEA